MKHVEGILKISFKGTGYVTPGPKAESIEIDPNFLNTALPGDLVRVLVHPAGAIGEPLTGEVEAILERKRLEFVGVLEKEDGFFYLVPDDRRVYKDILISPDRVAGGASGAKVLGRITEWRDPKKDPIGEVVKLIGRAGEHNAEMEAILYEKGFQPGFPEAVEKEAKILKQKAEEDSQEEAKKRRDFRSTVTLTIDPENAKDFDDALSWARLPNRHWQVGVHVADVAHYVRPDTALDREAQRRSTSVYLVDRTIPMLPEILSNDLCSLNPGEDKLTFSAVFTFNPQFKVVKQWFGRTIIRSGRRLTYEEAQKILDAKTGPDVEALLSLNQIAKKLRTEKEAGGALAFEKEEIKFVLDAAGRPLAVLKKKSTDSHKLIEDFMLLANRRVAEFVSKIVRDQEKKFVYRVHEAPDSEKIQQLAEFVAPLGYQLPAGKNGVTVKHINQLLKEVTGAPEENIVHTAAMRSMAKAVYSMKNIGHYGLAFAHYAHFTSPIRRYPDIMVHRLLDLYLRGETPAADLLKHYDELSLHCSQMEIQAQEAERDSIRYKQVEYLQNMVGQVFDATISGVTKWGIYVEEKNTLAEGLVRLMEMKDDFYVFDEKNYALVGERTGRRYRLGDEVKVKLRRADLKEKLLDFAFV